MKGGIKQNKVIQHIYCTGLNINQTKVKFATKEK